LHWTEIHTAAVIASLLQVVYHLVVDKLLWVICTEALTTAWTKFYCLYQKENRTLTMVAYNQTLGKGNSGVSS